MGDRDARLKAQMADEGFEISVWANDPGDRHLAHRHDYDKVLVVAEGDITFGLPEIGRTVRLLAGDRLDLPAGTLHDAAAGRAGVRCLEAHLAPGKLEPGPLHRPGWAVSDV